MPTLDAPSYYERSKTLAAGRADPFLKAINDDEYVSVTGEVEASIGWVGLINIERDLVATWVSSQGDPWMSEARNFDLGWYIVKIDDNGLIWGMYYGRSDDTLAEEGARADFAEADSTYSFWSELNDANI